MIDSPRCAHGLNFFFWPVVVAVAVGAVVAVSARPAGAAVRTQTITYSQDSVTLEGYLAYDDRITGKRPGILVVHEWKGISAYEKMRVEQLASMGYVAFAADIYGKGVRPTTTEEASRTAGIYRGNRQLLRARALAGLKALKEFRYTDPSRVAAIGYCFGGTTVLELARGNAEVAGVVSFHGGLDTPNPATGPVKPQVLVLTGADDPGVPPAQRLAFEEEMRAAGANWQMNIYSGAVHAFTNPAAGSNPSTGAAYNEKADKRSFADMKLFFSELFK
ncbi:MAG: dienelactone hydrolase family protein [Syntrophorhabdaceae bacterium]|nr:dienelactone hydrolase family protein [Syntrophorhabdaceae bacterium]